MKDTIRHLVSIFREKKTLGNYFSSDLKRARSLSAGY